MCRIPAAARATHALASEDFVFLPAGLMFVFAGVMLALAPERAALRRLFGALLVTAFALTLDWIAFGPGERRFSGGISLGIEIGFNPGALFGRIAAGIGAAILDVIAAVLWTREIRRLLARDARLVPPSPHDFRDEETVLLTVFNKRPLRKRLEVFLSRTTPTAAHDNAKLRIR